MSLTRAIAALLAGAGALLATSCVSALGLDEDKDSAIEKFCTCPNPLAEVFGGDKQKCISDLSRRLELATEPTRAQWLEKYAQTCAKDCDKWLECFRVPPTCRKLDEACPQDEVCCSGACGSSGCQ